jgi:hypothetical protein
MATSLRRMVRNGLDHSLRHWIWGMRCRLIHLGLSRDRSVRITISMEKGLKRVHLLG